MSINSTNGPDFAVLNNIQDGILIADCDHKIVYANRAMATIAGVDVSALIGVHMLNDFSEETLRFFRSYYLRAFNTREPVKWECPVVTPIGRQTWQGGWLSPMTYDGVFTGVMCSVQDITEKKSNEEDLRSQLVFKKMVFDTTQAIVLVLSLDGKIQDFNRFMENVCGYSLTEVEGKDWFSIFLPVSAQDETRTLFLSAIHNIQTKGNISPLVTKSGQVRLIEWHDKTLKGASGETLGLLAIGLDVTQRVELEQELRRINLQLEDRIGLRTKELSVARDAAETASLTKSRFLAAASHDLRQPMQAISLFSDALARTSLSGEQKRISDYLSKSIQSMDELLTALLDISKLDAGAIKVSPGVISTAALMHKINAEYSGMAAGKLLSFKLHFPFGDMAILTDGKLLMSLLGNLIGNAVKYTEKGGILVAIRRRRDQALFQVWDTGIGIPAEHMDTIYEEYFQVGNPERDRTKGLGLGLAIVRRIASLLETKVVCRSQPGKGSVFEFRLPLASRGERATSSRSVPPGVGNEATPAGRRVVLVEDDLMVATAMILTLEACGVTVTRYKTAEEALADPAITEADFYISDLRLPGLSGVEFLDAIQRRVTKPIQAVIVTGDTAIDRIEMMRSTSWRVLFKPVELSSLLSAIDLQDSVG